MSLERAGDVLLAPEELADVLLVDRTVFVEVGDFDDLDANEISSVSVRSRKSAMVLCLYPFSFYSRGARPYSCPFPLYS